MLQAMDLGVVAQRCHPGAIPIDAMKQHRSVR
jgi:hypothetical protein